MTTNQRSPDKQEEKVDTGKGKADLSSASDDEPDANPAMNMQFD